MGTVDDRLRDLGITLGEPVRPVAAYVMAVRSGDLLFVSGHVSAQRGRVGDDVGLDEARAAARAVALDMLATLRAELGDLDRVRRVVKLLGMVRSAAGFTDQPKVVNGASELLAEIFGEAGRHARSAVGMAELPLGASVELEAIFEVA